MHEINLQFRSRQGGLLARLIISVCGQPLTGSRKFGGVQIHTLRVPPLDNRGMHCCSPFNSELCLAPVAGT